MHTIALGVNAEISLVVASAHTAHAMGSGDLEVFATPALIALMEGAAVKALAPYLHAGASSVGVEIQVQHLAATPIGHTVRAQAEVIAVEGNQITLRVQAWDERDLIGEGTHRRAVIDIPRFMKRVEAKSLL